PEHAAGRRGDVPTAALARAGYPVHLLPVVWGAHLAHRPRGGSHGNARAGRVSARGRGWAGAGRGGGRHGAGLVPAHLGAASHGDGGPAGAQRPAFRAHGPRNAGTRYSGAHSAGGAGGHCGGAGGPAGGGGRALAAAKAQP
nr:hypothetical protein [Tanacetum cinerariifolium]